MLKYLHCVFLIVFSLFVSFQVLACDKNATCDKCAKNSEFSWNPDNQFVTDRLSRFYSLNDQIEAAYNANDFVKVNELAKENLELAAVYKCNWNYGNAIHDTNRILGLVSLKNGDIDAAADYLRKAGKSTGSPQLDTFGPELDLANELLKRGKVEAVVAYLNDIKSFWEMNNGQIDKWLAEIKGGGKPELDSSAVYEPGPFLIFLSWLTMAWPIVLSTTFLYAKRKHIKRKVLYFVIAALSGYALMFLTNWTASYVFESIALRKENLSEATIFLFSYLPLGVALLLPVLANLFQARFFCSKGSVSTANY